LERIGYAILRILITFWFGHPGWLSIVGTNEQFNFTLDNPMVLVSTLGWLSSVGTENNTTLHSLIIWFIYLGWLSSVGTDEQYNFTLNNQLVLLSKMVEQCWNG